MALQSEVSPTIVGDPNKDTQIDGDTKSDENHSSQSTDEDEDLEDGEIAESEAEEEKDFSNVSLKEALDKSCLQNIEQLVNQAKNAKNVSSPDCTKIISPRKQKRMADNYTDHDRAEHPPEHEKGGWVTSEQVKDGWVTASPKYKSKFGDKPIDYRHELAAYRGTPPSSPDRRRHKDDDKSKKKRSSKKVKKSKKTIRRKDAKGLRVGNYKKSAARGKICRFYKEGKCAKGSDCYFSHSTPAFKKRELCKFYLNGHCNKGKDCVYMHGEFPCKFYHTGSECYAKNDCRFSHVPLNEEMKKVLADYLRSCHGDDIRHNRSDDRDRDRNDHERERDKDRERDSRKRPLSRSPEPQPPPSKRTCLLGSPPRHIREAEETKRWQEEMKMLQEQNHPSFEIRLSPRDDDPIEFQKPNFYQETLLNTPSPVKRPPNVEPFFHQANNDEYEGGSPSSKVYIYDEDDFVEIDMSAVKQEAPEEYHWENKHSPQQLDVKPFVETPQPDLDFTTDVKFDETTQFSEMESSTDVPPAPSPDQSEEASNQQQSDNTTPPPPIVVPTHLPRIQQELFMRVQKHQRLNAASDESKKDNESDNEDKGEKDNEWYTSEEEDDEDDPPLTDVLKKMQQAPPPKPQPPEVKPSSKVDLLAIFNTIQQKTKEKNKGLTEVQQKHSSFWMNILGSVSSSKTAAPATNPAVAPPEQPKRRTLLPDPIATPVIKTEIPSTPAEPPTVKDPRLKNRDPRKMAREPKPVVDIPKPSTGDSSPSIIELPLRVKPESSSDQAKESIPYRLRGIMAKPLNYTPYVQASQSNPSLLKDPRLRKHLKTDPINGNEKDLDVVKPTPPKDAPPIPELLLKYEKPVAAINIFESTSSSKPSVPVPITIPVSYDPTESKSRLPVPVSYEPPDVKSHVPVSYEPMESKSNVPVPVSYDPEDSKSSFPAKVPYDPITSKRSIPAPILYDPLDSKSSVPDIVSYDPTHSKRKIPSPVSYDPVDSKKIAPVAILHNLPDSKRSVAASYDIVDSKPSVLASYALADSKPNVLAPISKLSTDSKSHVPPPVLSKPVYSKTHKTTAVTSDPVDSKSKAPLPVPATKSHVPIPVPVTRGPVSLKRRAPLSSSKKDPRTKRRDSLASNSSCDTPPHLTIADSASSPPRQDFKSAPVLENELMDTDEKKNPIEKKKISSPPSLEKNVLTEIKKEAEFKKNVKEIKKEVVSDSDSNRDPPPTLSVKSANKKSLEKKIAEIKKEVVSDLDSNPDQPPTLNVKSSRKKSPEKNITEIKKVIVSDSNDNPDPPPTLSVKSSRKKSTEKNVITEIKKEVVSDSNDNSDPPPTRSVKSSRKKSTEKNVITEIKKEVVSDSNDNPDLPTTVSVKSSRKKSTEKNIITEVKKEVVSDLDTNPDSPPTLSVKSSHKKSPEKNTTEIKKEVKSDSEDSNQDPPPTLSVKSSHKKSSSLPIMEEFMTVIKKEVPQDVTGDSKPVVPPLIIKKVKPSPTPASHLPKAIADPRMAKLHNPRRQRLAASVASPPKRVSERRKQPATETAKTVEEDSSVSKREASKPAKTSKEEKPKVTKSIPKKRRLSDKSEEKKKTVHRNRKSSMDYASPLNSCDATVGDDKSTSYNRYNQRPKRGVTVGKVSPVTIPSQSDSNSIPEFVMSDSSNLECDNSNDVNLKDRFKTIDPTASPFC